MAAPSPRSPIRRTGVMRSVTVFAVAASTMSTLSHADGDELEPDAPPEATSPQAQREAVATELFNTARSLMEDERNAEACPKLAESAKLALRVGTLGKLAECEEAIGQLVSARAHWQQAANLARAQGDDRLRFAEQALSALDARVPKLDIKIYPDAPHDLAIRLDNLQVGLSSIGLPIPLDPGPHRISVTAQGMDPWEATITLVADGTVQDVRIPKLKPSFVPTATAAAPAPSPPEGPGTLGITGVVTGSVGLVGLGFGVFFGALASARLDDSNNLGCRDNLCGPTAAAARDSAREAGTLSTVFFVAGGALVAMGITLWVLDPGAPGQGGAQASTIGLSAKLLPDLDQPEPQGGVFTLQGDF